MDEWDADEFFSLVTRRPPTPSSRGRRIDADPRPAQRPLSSEEFAELRPRIVSDRVTGSLSGPPGAQRLAVTSGGTIPDHGLFGVFLVGEKASRWVELDEEMVYESRVGDTLRARRDQLADRGRHPRPGPRHARARHPGPAAVLEGRHPGSTGRARGGRRRLHPRAGARCPAKAIARVRERGLDANAATNLVTYIGEQREATQVVPSDTQILVERFRDELGDWRLVVHSPYGVPVHAPWALAINARLRERFDIDGQPSPPTTASSSASPTPMPSRPPVRSSSSTGRRSSSCRHAGGRRLGTVRQPVPRVCRPRAPASPSRPGPAQPPLAAAPAQRPAPRGRLALPVVPDRARGRARVPPGRLRPAVPHRAARPDRASRGHRRRHRHDHPQPLRPQPALRLRRPVRLRRRLPHRRASGRRPLARPGPACRAPRPRRAARAARPRGPRGDRGRAAVARPRPTGAQRGGGHRPAAARRSPLHR